MPQSNLPSGEPQPERLEGIADTLEKDEDIPERRPAALRSMKLWLRLANAADLELKVAVAAQDGSIPYEDDVLNDGED